MAELGPRFNGEFDVLHCQFRVWVRDGWIKTWNRHCIAPLHAELKDSMWSKWELTQDEVESVG